MEVLHLGEPTLNTFSSDSFPIAIHSPQRSIVARMLEAVLVSFCDHGVTPPSTQAARMIASAGSPVHACIAGGLLAFGKNHAGAIERSMKLFQETVSSCDSEDEIPDVIVKVELDDEGEFADAGINIRPYLYECLQEASKHFQVITAAKCCVLCKEPAEVLNSRRWGI